MAWVGVFVAAVGFFYLVGRFTNSGETKKTSKGKNSRSAKQLIQIKDEYTFKVEVLRKNYPNVHEFEVHGTKAAILSGGECNEYRVVCRNRFVRGEASGGSYEWYTYYPESKSFVPSGPSGATARVRQELDEVFGV